MPANAHSWLRLRYRLAAALPHFGLPTSLAPGFGRGLVPLIRHTYYPVLTWGFGRTHIGGSYSRTRASNTC